MTATVEYLANYVVTSVAGGAGGTGSALASTDTTLLLPTGIGADLSAQGPSRLLVGNLTLGTYEIMSWATRSGDTLSGLVRGLEGTTAQTWAYGTTVQSVATAGTFAAIIAAINTGRLFYVEDYGAKGDGVLDRNCAITSGAAALSTTTSPGPFTAGMVGRSVLVRGAGTSGADLWTTISAFTDAQHVTLAANAATTVSAAFAFVVQTDDFPAIQSAFNAAASVTGGTVVFGPHVYYANFLNSSFGLSVPAYGSVRIIGSGRDSTFIVPSGAAASSGSCFASTSTSGGYLTAEDLTLIAPATPNGVYARGFWHQGAYGRLTVRRCAVWSFGTSIEADTATAGLGVDVLIDQCDLSTHPVLNLGGSCASIGDIGAGKYTAISTQFHDFGVAGSNANHATYVHQGVDMDITHCRFYNQRGTGWCIHNFNGSGTSINASIDDCYFDTATVYQAVLTNPTVRTRIQGCRLGSTFVAVTVQYDCDINGCQFEGVSSGNNYVKQSSLITAATVVTLRDCTFVTPATTGTNPIFNNNSTNANTWKAIACRFTCNQSAAAFNSSPSLTILAGCSYADDGAAHDVLTGGAAPSAGTFATNIANVSITGNDAGFYVQFDVQTSSIASGTALMTITFATAYSVAPIVLITNETANVNTISFGVSAVGTASFVLRNLGTLGVSTGQRVACLVRHF